MWSHAPDVVDQPPDRSRLEDEDQSLGQDLEPVALGGRGHVPGRLRAAVEGNGPCFSIDVGSAVELLGAHHSGALDRRQNPRIRAAATDVVPEPGSDRVVIGLGRGLEQGDRRQDHARRAVAALEGALREKRLLNPVELAGRREALDRQDLMALRRRHQRSAASNGLPVDEDCAGATDALATAGLRTGDVELVAQDPEEGPLRLTRNRSGGAVDVQVEGARRIGRMHV